MGEPGAVTTETLRHQALAKGEGLDTPMVVLLLPRTYAEAVASLWPSAQRLLAEATSRGTQLQRLASLGRPHTHEQP